ncbi:MAG: cysteine peptidase family C39 domain-containing protein [Blastocatellia bacterium]
MMPEWFAQELSSSCVSACVRMALSGFKLHPSEQQVRSLLGHSKFGLSLLTAQERLAAAGAKVAYRQDFSVDDLRDELQQGRYPIVGVERHLLGFTPASHAVVLIELSSRHVRVLDPYDGPGRKQYGLATFTQSWITAGREVLLIEAPPLIN